MGENSLPKLAAAPTLVPATTTQYNAAVDALQGHLVMRDSAGAVEDGVSDIGRPSAGRPRKLYLSNGLNVAGQDIDFSSISLQNTGVYSGKSKTSGFPNFLTASGSTVIIEGATVPLELTIDGEALTLETNLTSDSLELAAAANNTCTISQSAYTNSTDKITPLMGEFGGYFIIGSITSGITAIEGTKQYFKVVNTGAETEIFLAEYIDAPATGECLNPIMRGLGGTNRIYLRDTNVVTLLKANYIFLKNDLETIYTTTNIPVWNYLEPSAPASGDFWFDLENQTWKRYSGVTWEQLGFVYLGIAICDNIGCIAVEHVDYNLAYNNFLSLPRFTKATSDIINFAGELKVNVAGTNIYMDLKHVQLALSENLAAGESEAASTWYYLYCTKQGQLYFSSICPRRSIYKQGYYHPLEYHRAILCIFNNSSSNIASFTYSNGNSNYAFLEDTFVLLDLLGAAGSIVYCSEFFPLISNFLCSVHLDLVGNNDCTFTMVGMEYSKYTPAAINVFKHYHLDVDADTEVDFLCEINQFFGGRYYAGSIGYGLKKIVLHSFNFDFKV
jgi:hypothetical protein